MNDVVRNIHLDFFNLVKRHLRCMSICDGGKQYTGYVESEEQYNVFFDDLKALGFSFSTENSKIHKHSRILFSFTKNGADIQIPYFGTPFQILKTSYMLCSQGGNYRPQSLLPTEEDNFSSKKRRFSMQPTKKIGCKAFMTVKCIRMFTDDCYKAKSAAYKDGSYENRMIMNKLNKDLLSASPPTGSLRFIILMSSAKEHNHTIVSTNLNQIIHPKLRQEIYKIAKVNTTYSVRQMKLHLEKFVRKMFEDKGRPQPDIVNRCYYPTDTALRFHMRQAGFMIKQGKRQKRGLEQCIVIQTLKAENDSTSDLNNIEYYAGDPDIQFCLPELKYVIDENNDEQNATNQCIVIQTTSSEYQAGSDVDMDENKEPNVHLQVPTECCVTKESDHPKNSMEPCIVIHSTEPEYASDVDMDVDLNSKDISYRYHSPHDDLTMLEGQHQPTGLERCIIITAHGAEDQLHSDINISQAEDGLSTLLPEPVGFMIKKRKYQERGVEIIGTESEEYSICDVNINDGEVGPDTQFHVPDSEEGFDTEPSKNQDEIVEHYIVINAADTEDQTNSEIDMVQGEEIVEFYTEGELFSNVSSTPDEGVVNSWNTEADTDTPDLKKLWYEARENLKVIMRYTYEEHNPENILEIAQLTQQLKDKVLASATEASGCFPSGTIQLNEPKHIKKKTNLKSFKKKYISVPKHTILRTRGNYVD